MDNLTTMLMLAVGSFVFGLLLIVFKYRKSSPQQVPFWITAKFLQAAGSLMLYFRVSTFDFLTIMLANDVLLLGCAYEAWAIRIISDQPVNRRLHIFTSLGIVSIGLLNVFLAPQHRMAVTFILQSVFYFLPGLFLFSKSGVKSSLRTILGVSYFFMGMLFLLCALLFFMFQEHTMPPYGKAIFEFLPPASFCIFLISGFIMLMLAKEKSDMQIQEINRQLAELTKKDGLTGIDNRRSFDETLDHEYSRLKRTNSNLSVILLDLDYFKAFNDCYGHVKGDECLRQIGDVLASCINRSVDLAARYGGEEFACILPDTDIRGAVVIAENIRQMIQTLNIPHKGSAVSDCVTASLGVISVKYSEERSMIEILVEVDKQLYQAKSSGRNRVEFMEI